ncbi:MAG: lanthionine synthetase C family protein [Alphaproteobacteria bacterium]|nr:lanthionine synthetase C family protein [Alphaproteobacteria bacterium]
MKSPTQPLSYVLERNKRNKIEKKDLDHLINTLSERLKNPDYIYTFMQDPLCDPLSLAEGYPGLLILFVILYQRGMLAESKEKLIHPYILKIKEAAENTTSLNLSLFSGIAGICFALKFAVTIEGRYGRLLETLNTILLNHMEQAYFNPLMESIKQNQSRVSGHYDVIQGISGVGYYALSNMQNPLFKDLSQKILNVLVALCKPFPREGITIPGWHVTKDDPLNKNYYLSTPEGNFNLGFSHGVPGILGLLSAAALKGVVVKGQKETIQILSEWVCKKSFKDAKDAIRWSHSVSWKEELSDKLFLPKEPSQDGWCYGVPGVARSLFLAGRVLEDKNLKDYALKAFQGIFTRSPADWKLHGPAVCHGISGLLLLTFIMAQETRCLYLTSQVSYLQEILLSHYKPDSSFGFQDIEYGPQGEHIAVDKPGFMNGTAGILLTLLTLTGPVSDWHLPFLAYV